MIVKDEILAFADETGLTPNVVEKDYVLGWLLAAVNSNPVLSQSWVFKGGTCLKKCYFETYRFSEDLDFTLRDQSHINETVLKEQFVSISEWLYEETGIEFPLKHRYKLFLYASIGDTREAILSVLIKRKRQCNHQRHMNTSQSLATPNIRSVFWQSNGIE